MPERLGGVSEVLAPEHVGTADESVPSGGADGQRWPAVTASTYAWLGLAVVVMASFVVPIVIWRPMDGDEGFYSIATKLVAHGETPYADFWFQHAPLLPYVYGVVERVLGSSWYVLRGTSAVFTMLLGGAVAVYGLRRWRSPALAFLAATLFITTPLVVWWDPTIKSYALSTLLLFGAYVAADASSRRGWVAAGVLLGLAVDTRLLFATVIVVFALYARRHLIEFGAGLLAGLLPLLLFFAAGPRRFVNDTVMSQVARSHVAFADNASQKLDVVGRVVTERHYLVLFLGALGLLLVSVIAHRRVPLAVAIALTLGVTNLSPTPTYGQYFVTLVPFLVVASVDLVAKWHPSNVIIAGIALLAVVTAASVPIDVMPSSTRGAARPRFDVSGTREVSTAVDAHAQPGEEVLAFWPGFLYETHAQPMPGMESEFVVEAVENTHLTRRRAHGYHMLSEAEIAEAIRSHRTRLIVLSRRIGHLGFEPWNGVMLQAGYRPIEKLQLATVYEYRAAGE